MSDDKRTKAISAVEFAAVSDIDNLASDRLQAMVGGHGMLNLSVYAVADVIAEQLMRGADIKMTNANAVRIPLQDVVQKCLDVCKAGGCDPANAALITAVELYLAGTNAQVGIPAGNRKLGAMARIMAGAPRCGVSNIPTSKTSSKISGFPAVQAIYQAMHDRTLIDGLDGSDLHWIMAGSAFYGHGALGEDIFYPQLSANGARIGTEAMMDAYIGAGMVPNSLECAIFGAAAILEIVHPDAEVSEELGPYGKYNSCMHAGKAAVKAAGLPEKVHIRGTNEELDLGEIVGDLGLILKDVGGPSVIGMMAMDEILSVFSEALSGGSFSGANSPLGHSGGAGVQMLKALQFYDWDEEKAMACVTQHRVDTSLNPEMGMSGLNITARKAQLLYRGPVTDLLIRCSEPYRAYSIHRRCEYCYDRFTEGADLATVVWELEEEKLHTVERNAERIYSVKYGAPVKLKILEVRPGARRKKSKLASKYLAFDGYFKVDVSFGDKHTVIDGLQNEVYPAYVRHELDEDISWALPLVGPPCEDQVLSGNHLENIIVPAAMAVLLGKNTIEEAADIACETAIITGSIPGCKAPAKNVAGEAKRIFDVMTNGVQISE